jgi:SAM-dependent methyltransferase
MDKNKYDISFSPRTMGFYSVKKAILDSLKSNLPNFYGNLIDIGCGNQPYKELLLSNPKVKSYTGLDIDYPFAQTKPDLYWDGKKIPLADATMDTVILTEVLEHCPDPDQVFREIHRIMRPGGKLFLTIPFLWMLHEVPHDEYRYTPFSLTRHLKNAGFADIQLQSLGGWDASLAQMMGMWIEYRKRPKLVRIFFKIVLAPFYLLLLSSDKKQSFDDLTMITGIHGLITK